MNKTNIALGVALVAVVIAIIGIFTPGQTAGQKLGNISDYFTGDYFVATIGNWLGVPAGKTPSDTNGQLTLFSTGSCSTASSTIFSVANPFNGTAGTVAGTSTAYMTLFGTQGATTTEIIVATSTTIAPAGLAVATSSVPTSFFGAASVATSSNFFFSSGNTASWNKGGYPNTAEIQVGPNEFLNGFSTSTYGGSGAGTNGAVGVGLLGIPASCTYKITWYR